MRECVCGYLCWKNDNVKSCSPLYRIEICFVLWHCLCRVNKKWRWWKNNGPRHYIYTHNYTRSLVHSLTYDLVSNAPVHPSMLEFSKCFAFFPSCSLAILFHVFVRFPELKHSGFKSVQLGKNQFIHTHTNRKDAEVVIPYKFFVFDGCCCFMGFVSMWLKRHKCNDAHVIRSTNFSIWYQL